MLFIRELEPKLNKQSNSIRAKVFTYPFTFNFVSFASAFLLLFFRNFLVLLLWNILEFSQYFISIFTIDYISAWQKNFILQLENDRWAIETSLLFNVNFHDSHRPNLLRTINLQLSLYEKISLHLIMHQSSWLELLGNIIHSGLVSIWLLPLPHHPRLQSVTQTKCIATELHTADQSDTQVSHNLK